MLWDCLPLLDEMATFVESRGGLRAIAISHPHYYTTMVEWAHRFDCPVLIHELDREWVLRPDDVDRLWSGETRELWDDLTLLRLGGHFAGGQVLHWPAGDALLSGDIVQVLPGSRWVSFMYSYPMLIPLPAREVERMAAALEPYAVRADLRRLVGTRHSGEREGRCGAFCASLRRSDRLTSRQSRSAFATRNASDSSGSAGRPPRSSHTANAIVAPNDAVISTHVNAVLNRKRSVAPRKSAKNSMSGIPRFAVPLSPGTGNANERCSNTPAW